MMPSANVYVDGFNLYYGCFDDRKNRLPWHSYRWLDLAQFCRNAYPAYELNRIRYFTALVQPRDHNPDCQQRQQIYLRALKTLPNLDIHLGRFAITAKERGCAVRGARRPTPERPPRSAYVIQEEEKGSDVNLATYLMLDAFREEADVTIVVSNDSDLAEPIRVVRNQLGRTVCILNPRKQPAVDLSNIADRIDPVREWMVRQAQFPVTLTDNVGTFGRPTRWQ